MLWPSRAEMKKTVDRNMVEFAAEGFEWRDATEENGMYLDSTGDFIHPIHVWKNTRSCKTPCSVMEPVGDVLHRPLPQRPKHPSMKAADIVDLAEKTKISLLLDHESSSSESCS